MPEEVTKDKKRFHLNGLKSFSVFDLVLLAMLTAVSVAFKLVVGILVRLITGPLGIPGGALAGGFYMLWLPLAIVLVGRRGSALVMAAVQTIIMITTGAPGSHGVWTILTYLSPALFTELVFIYRPKNGYNILHFIISTILANMAGTIGSNLLFFRMSIYPLLFTLLAASLSGALGGAVAYFAYVKVVKSGVLKNLKAKTQKKQQTDSDDDWGDDETPSAEISPTNLENNQTGDAPLDENINEEQTQNDKIEKEISDGDDNEKEN